MSKKQTVWRTNPTTKRKEIAGWTTPNKGRYLYTHPPAKNIAPIGEPARFVQPYRAPAKRVSDKQGRFLRYEPFGGGA